MWISSMVVSETYEGQWPDPAAARVQQSLEVQYVSKAELASENNATYIPRNAWKFLLNAQETFLRLFWLTAAADWVCDVQCVVRCNEH